MKRFGFIIPALASSLLSLTVSAWDYEGHRLVNQLALASLPTNFPAFVREPANAERVAFLAGEPDRWRNTPDLPLKHLNGPDHYIDLEQLDEYGLKAEQLPIFRYDFIGQLANIRKQNPDKFPVVTVKNEDHTRELVGLLPWAVTENYGKVKSGFSYLKAFQQHGGTADEIANAQADIIYIMGVMGHYVGDASQPLHTTVHHHGWVGENPNHYSTNGSIHGFIDGFFKKDAAALFADAKPKLRPAQVISVDGQPADAPRLFRFVVTFLSEQQKQVEPLYQLDKAHKLNGQASEGKAFLEGQILKSAQLLGDIWLTAWQQAPEDSYLTTQLSHRTAPNEK